MPISFRVRNMDLVFSPHNQNFILTILNNTKHVTLFCSSELSTDILVYIQKNRKNLS